MSVTGENTGRRRSFADLLAALVDQATTLAQQEARLACSEMGDAVGRIAASAMTVVIATALLISGLVVLLQAAVIALEMNGVSPIWSVVIVGVIVLAIGAIMLSSAIAAIRKTDVVPRRAMAQVQQDVAVAKEHAR